MAEGLTTLTYFARDNAGSLEPPKTLEIRLDKTAPLVRVSRNVPPNANGWDNSTCAG